MEAAREADRRNKVEEIAVWRAWRRWRQARRLTQIMNLLCLAPDIQEQILFLPATERGRDPITEKQLRPMAAVLSWNKQRRMGRKRTIQ